MNIDFLIIFLIPVIVIAIPSLWIYMIYSFKNKYRSALKNKDKQLVVKYGRKYHWWKLTKGSEAELKIQNDMKANNIF